jgi:hypothetical protein
MPQPDASTCACLCCLHTWREVGERVVRLEDTLVLFEAVLGRVLDLYQRQPRTDHYGLGRSGLPPAPEAVP